MGTWPLYGLWNPLAGAGFLLGLLWLTLAGIGAALLVLVTTRWGRSRVVKKCLILSALIHAWLAVFSTTLTIVTFSPPASDPEIRVSLAGDELPEDKRASLPPFGLDSSEKAAAGKEKPWEVSAQPPPVAGPRAGSARAEPRAAQPPDRQARRPVSVPVRPAALEHASASESPAPPPRSPPTDTQAALPEAKATPDRPPTEPRDDLIEAPGTWKAVSRESIGERPSNTLSTELPRPLGSDSEAGAGGASGDRPQPPRNPRPAGPRQTPEIYRLRTAPDRARQAASLGANPRSEAAVAAALGWLAANQESDGRWNARKHGGGRETMEAGRDRLGAGSRADTGITGLALLAFAASGNTHRDGPHQSAARRGLQYLLRAQAQDGNLAGQAETFEFMYCHGMATLAVAELFGMTGDEDLREPLTRAVAYTLAVQDPIGGGWRYRFREPGDMSQFGWQVMALKSAQLAGVRVPEQAWHRAALFLDTVSAGSYRGLAAYRPGEPVSRTMTAEALVCRVFLGLSPDSPTAREAGDFLLAEMPGEGYPNLYYWYYATLGMFQLQGAYWNQWTQALQQTLLTTQRTTGAVAGSWDPNTRWDGYGGRVYSTALSALCLESFYRFLPFRETKAVASRPAR